MSRDDRNQEKSRIVNWTGFQGKTLWDWLQLLLVPLLLAVGVAVLEIAESRRQEENLAEQYKQQILRDYFNDINSLIFDSDKFKGLQDSPAYDPRREVLGARTLSALKIFGEDEDKKNQIIRFIASSSLSSLIPIRRANLSDLDLSGATLTGVDLRASKLNNTDLTGANLGEAYLCSSDLSGADLEGAILTNARYNKYTKLEGVKNLSKKQLDLMDEKSVDSCGPDTLETTKDSDDSAAEDETDKES